MTDPSPVAAASMLERVRERMTERNLSQQDLAEVIGVSESVMSRMLNGKRKITAAELGYLADRLGVSSSYLLGTSDSPGKQSFAMAARLGALGTEHTNTALEKVFARGSSLFELRGFLDRVLETGSQFEPVVISEPTSSRYVEAGTQLAENARAALGIGDEPIVDLSALAEDAFAMAVSVEPMNEELHGVLLTEPASSSTVGWRSSIAFINSQDTVGRQRFTLAHELGHVICGDADEYWVDYRQVGVSGRALWIERRSDVFASAFLAPERGVRALFDARPLAPEGGPERRKWLAEFICDVAFTFGMSIDSARWRSKNLALLSEADERLIFQVNSTSLVHLAGRDDDLTDGQNVIEPPPGLTSRALFAYVEGMAGVSSLMPLWMADDSEVLRTQLADAGWGPRFS